MSKKLEIYEKIKKNVNGFNIKEFKKTIYPEQLKEAHKYALEYIPNRILQLLNEIDTLRQRHNEIKKEYFDLHKKEQENLIKTLEKVNSRDE